MPRENLAVCLFRHVAWGMFLWTVCAAFMAFVWFFTPLAS